MSLRLVFKPEYIYSKSKVDSWEQPNIEELDIGDFVEEHMTSHGMNRNLKRDIPFFYDNLKVVHRRILYSMARAGLTETKLSKSADAVGKTLSLHPHSDSAAYEAMIFMRQPWKHLLPLVAIKGNYGRACDPSTYAQMRYTECGLTEFARDCFFDPNEWDLKSDVVDMKPSFNGESVEPVYLPAKYPLFLMSWTKGIGQGLSTMTPGFLPQDAMNAVTLLIDDPNAKFVLYPEDPTGCTILDKKVFKKLVDFKPKKGKEDENLKYRIRSKYEVDADGNIMVLNAPYEINMQTVYDRIIELVSKGKLDGIVHAEIRTAPGSIPTLANKSDVARMWIEVKKGYDPYIVMERLFKMTDLEKTYPIIQVYVMMSKNVQYYSLREAILEWIAFRRRVLIRMHRLRLSKESKRVYVLDALIDLFEKDQIGDLINIIRTNKSTRGAIDEIYDSFNISSYQAEQLADMKVRNLGREGYEKYVEEREALQASLKKISDILRSDTAIDDIIKEQMRTGIKKYSRKRISEVIDLAKEGETDTPHTISVTHNAFIKRLPEGVFENGELPGDAKLVYMQYNVSSQDKLFMFTPTGRVYSEVVYKLSTSDTVGIGVSLRRLVKNDNLEIVSAVSAGANTKASLIFVTKNGTVKQTKLADYFGASQGGSAIKLKTDDVLAGVVSLRSDRDKFLIYTKNGMSILFDAKDVTTTSRSTAGVNGIRLEEGDEVMGACVVSPSDTHIITIADRGEMKRISLETSLTDMKRGTGGVALVSKSETLNAVFAVNPKVTSIKYMVGSEVKEIVVEDIPVKTRVSNGDKKINALRGEKPIRVIE